MVELANNTSEAIIADCICNLSESLTDGELELKLLLDLGEDSLAIAVFQHHIDVHFLVATQDLEVKDVIHADLPDLLRRAT